MRNNSPDCAPPFVVFLAAFLASTVALADDSRRTAAEQEVVNQLAGGWRLVSRVTTGSDGEVLIDPGLSVTPSGVLIYDHFGHVAAQLSRPGRTLEVLGEECRAA